MAIINHGAFRLLHPLLIVQRAVGPTELAVPPHQISAGGVIDADVLARLTDAYAFLRNHLDESLPLIIGWLAVLKPNFSRVDVLLQGCALLQTAGPAHRKVTLWGFLDMIIGLTGQIVFASLDGLISSFPVRWRGIRRFMYA